MPSLESIHRRFKGQRFNVIGIDLGEKQDTVLSYLQANGITYPNLLDSGGKVSDLYGVSSTPVKFLIDKEGNMVAAALGYRDWERQEFSELIELLIR